MKLRKLRKQRNWSMKQLGEMIGCSESTISLYETGKREPSFETLLKLGQLFDVSVDYLLGATSENKNQEKPFNAICIEAHKETSQISTIPERIKHLRNLNGLTLEEVGNVVCVGKSTVRKWETGLIANMQCDKIALLAKALHTTPEYLMGWESSSDDSASSLTFDDFTYSLCSEAQKLTEENKQKLLEMAQFFHQQQEKE